MTVAELISKLQLMRQDLQVYGLCEHGGNPEKICDPSLSFTNSLDHYLWDDHSSFEDDARDLGYDEAFVLL